MRNRFAVIAVLAAMPFATATAQNAAVPVKQIISVQPLDLILTVFAAEYERAARKDLSWGVGMTSWDAGDAPDEVKYLSGDFKMRYYPQGVVLHGFSFGGSVGFSSIKATNSSGGDETASGPSFGVLLEYQWLLGEAKKFAVALGVGAKMLAVDDKNISSSSFTARYPTARISVGWGF